MCSIKVFFRLIKRCRGDLKNSYKDFILYFYEIRELVHFLNSNNLEIKNATKIAKKRLLWMEKL